MVEFFGDTAAGKTQLLYHVIVQFVLPENWNGQLSSLFSLLTLLLGLILGGNNARVIVFDNDFHFDVIRISNMLRARICKQLKSHNRLVKEVSAIAFFFFKKKN